MIELNRITLTNFKVFGGDPYTINLEDNRLVLLDGPNGYGKTSVFDAIELGLTGNISRLVTLENRQNPADVVVAYNGSEHVAIILEFKDKDSNLRIFQRKLKNPIPSSSKKISKFPELWELHEIVDGVPKNVSQETLNKLFGSKDFTRDLLLFHYVQQEETSRFLKTKNETQRAEELAQLFGNTREAEETLKKFLDIQQKIRTSKKRVSARIDEIKRTYRINEGTSVETGTNEPHLYALPWLAQTDKSPFWDASKIPELNQDKFNGALAEISSIKGLHTYQNYFLRSRSFENAIQQREVLELFVGYVNSINDHELHITRSKTYKLIENCRAKLRSGELKQIRSIENYQDIFQALGLGSNDAFEVSVNALLEGERKANGLNSIYSEILKHHDAMSAGLRNAPDETACFLCGQDYQAHEALSKAIVQHGHILRAELSGQDKIAVAARDAFNATHLFPLIKACDSYLQQRQAASDQDLLSLSKALTMKDRFEKLQNWLVSERIDHDDLLAITFPIIGREDFIASAVDNLCSRIREAMGSAPDGYYEANGGNVFDRIYRDYFNSNREKLSQVDNSSLERKESYIKSLYFSALKGISEELSKLMQEDTLLMRAADDVSGLTAILKSKIKQYRKKLITDIEIPFYIYSGKILQTHQAGLGQGIFVKDPSGEDELRNVRLVSNWESGHDIVNTMSSGQISAVVIALTLALNKVYSTKFSSILIDDPVQTMDDVNMSSLVELLRNDFSQKQIILSTHEDKVARYFTYKYLKHSESVKIINLMQRKEYIPSNKFVYSHLQKS